MLSLNPWVWVILGVAAVSALGGAYVKGRSDGRALEFAERATMDEVARVAGEAASAAASAKIAQIEVKNVTVRQTLETQIREKPVYRNCTADQRVLDTVNEAITGNPPARQGELPAASSDGGSDLR